MKNKKYIVSSIILVVVVIFVLLILNIDRSDMQNTQKILVTEGETGKLYEIDDQKIIKKIVAEVIKDETPGLDIDIYEPYDYSLEFFTKEHGYGPLLCFRGLQICIFEEETDGNYIEVDENFFKLIEEGISK